ncbi:hypothetical protein DFS34DRAFT_159274 [Phlyctochytrium arcticum]|nr:hypothetical protein DFS34DRAFT_159274 [Phlyctochytrium arcticum]
MIRIFRSTAEGLGLQLHAQPDVVGDDKALPSWNKKRISLSESLDKDTLALRRTNTRDSAVSISTIRLKKTDDSAEASSPRVIAPTEVANAKHNYPSYLSSSSSRSPSPSPTLERRRRQLDDDSKSKLQTPDTHPPAIRNDPDSSTTVEIHIDPPPVPLQAPQPRGDRRDSTDAPVDDQGIIKAPIPWRTTNMQSAWTALQDSDSWGTAQQWSSMPTEDSNSNVQTFSMQEVPSSRRGWGRHRRVGPNGSGGPFSRRFGSRQRTCLWAVLGALITVIVVTVVVVSVRLQKRQQFDPQAGPRGGLPAPPPGPPLPVLNVLELNSNSSTIPGIYFGASIDWAKEDPQSFNRAYGHNAAIIDGYYMISETLERVNTVNSSGISHTIPDYFNWTAGLIGGTGAIMGMTLMPHKGLDNVTDDAMTQLGLKCAEINSVGIPIMLRFAPEMNGNWYPWGQSPEKYKLAFQRLAKIVRSLTDFGPLSNNATRANGTSARTAMVWAPAAAQGYPYTNGINSLYAPAFNDTRFRQMDTNGDLVLNGKDDPFLPYYPGDEFVDWIGLTALFNTTLGRNATVASAMASSGFSTVVPAIGTTTTTTSSSAAPSSTTSVTRGINVLLPDDLSLPALNFSNVIPPSGRDRNGTSFESIVSGFPGTFDLYDFASKRKKPLVVGETGVGYLTGPGISPSPTELEVKKAWWDQIFNSTFLKEYPLIRAVVWYDYALPIANTSLLLDYSLTRNETIIAAFANTTKSLPIGTLIYGNESSYGVNDTALGLTRGRPEAGASTMPLANIIANGTLPKSPVNPASLKPNGDALVHTPTRT